MQHVSPLADRLLSLLRGSFPGARVGSMRSRAHEVVWAVFEPDASVSRFLAIRHAADENVVSGDLGVLRRGAHPANTERLAAGATAPPDAPASGYRMALGDWSAEACGTRAVSGDAVNPDAAVAEMLGELLAELPAFAERWAPALEAAPAPMSGEKA